MEQWQDATYTTIFLLRPLGFISKSEVIHDCHAKRKYNLINAYLKDVDHPTNVKFPVFVLFKPKNLLDFENFVQDEKETGLLVEDYDYPEGYVVLLYKFPDEYERDYQLVINGKYSRTSKEFKGIFPQMDTGGLPTITYLVLSKHEELRKKREDELDVQLSEDTELWDPFMIEKETLNIGKILMK